MSVTSYYVISHNVFRIPVLAAHGSTPEEATDLFRQWVQREHNVHMPDAAQLELIGLLAKARRSVACGGQGIEADSIQWTEPSLMRHQPEQFVKLPITAQAA